MNWTEGLANDWFVAAYASAERSDRTLYASGGAQLARYKRTSSRAGIDLGQPWGRFGEFRLGLQTQRRAATPTLVSGALGGTLQTALATEIGLRAAAVIDQLDFANFPQRGYRLVGEISFGDGTEGGRYQRLEASALGVKIVGRHTVALFASARGASQQEGVSIGRYELGGFQQMSGYHEGQLLGNYVVFSRLTWYMRLAQTPALARGYFVGASAEAGNAYVSRAALRGLSLRSGMSLFFGADTGLGPLCLALTHAPRGQTGVVLFIGRP